MDASCVNGRPAARYCNSFRSFSASAFYAAKGNEHDGHNVVANGEITVAEDCYPPFGQVYREERELIKESGHEFRFQRG